MQKVFDNVQKVLDYGNAKYGDDALCYTEKTIYDFLIKALGHLMRSKSDLTGIDSDSGIEHIYHCIADLVLAANIYVKKNE